MSISTDLISGMMHKTYLISYITLTEGEKTPLMDGLRGWIAFDDKDNTVDDMRALYLRKHTILDGHRIKLVQNFGWGLSETIELNPKEKIGVCGYLDKLIHVRMIIAPPVFNPIVDRILGNKRFNLEILMSSVNSIVNLVYRHLPTKISRDNCLGFLAYLDRESILLEDVERNAVLADRNHVRTLKSSIQEMSGTLHELSILSQEVDFIVQNLMSINVHLKDPAKIILEYADRDWQVLS